MIQTIEHREEGSIRVPGRTLKQTKPQKQYPNVANTVNNTITNLNETEAEIDNAERDEKIF